jgi:hypothetical protein
MSAFHFILGNQDKFLGRGARNEEGMAILKALLPMEEDSTRRAVARKVKLVLGTDSVAGMHGQNSEEFIYRVIDGGQKPMDAIISGTSLAAESLGIAIALAPSLPAFRRTWWRRTEIRRRTSPPSDEWFS